MIKDKSRALVKMGNIDEDLSRVKDMEGEGVESMTSFSLDSKHSHLFEVLSGEAVAATTWREMSNSDEVTGLFSLKAGDAVLYLPGEPYLIKFTSAEVSEFVLGKNV